MNSTFRRSWFHRTFLAGLRGRLVLLILLAIIPALGLILHTASEQRRVARAEARDNALRFVRLAANNQEQMMESTRQLLTTLGQLPVVRQGSAAACHQLLSDLMREYPAYANLGVLDVQGKGRCSVLPFNPATTAADRPYFQQAIQTKKFAVGDYQIGRVTQKATLNFAYPVLNRGGQVQVVVFAAMDLAWLNRVSVQAKLPEGGVISLVDHRGKLLMRHPNPQPWIGQSLPTAAFEQMKLAQGEGAYELKSLDGVPRIFAFAPLGQDHTHPDAYIRVGIPIAQAYAEADRSLLRNLIGLGVVTILALVAAWVGGDFFLLKPVESLLQATQQLRAGNLQARSQLIQEEGELGQLARAFNEMADAIEQREQAIAALNRDLQNRIDEFQTLFEVIPVGILITNDSEFKQVRANPAFAEILGLAPQGNASSTPPAGQVRPSYRIFSHGKELSPEETPLRYAAIHGVNVEHAEVDVLRSDGTWFNLFGYASPLFDEWGKSRGAVGAFLNITDRKQAEAEREQLLQQLETSFGQLEAVINSMTEGVITADAQGRILMFNPAALHLHEFDHPDQVRQPLHEFQKIFDVRDAQGNVIPLEEWPVSKVLRGETFSNWEIHIRHLNTGKSWIGSYSGTPVCDKQGHPILAVVTLHDVTEQRQAQADLVRSLAAEQVARTVAEQARREAEAANRIKDEFLAVLSHELRTPLNPILGWTKLLRSGHLDAQKTDMALQTIERNAMLQTQLIEDLLDISRILQGKLTLNVVPVNLAETIEAAQETVRLAAEAKSIQLQAHLDTTIRPILGDPNRLQQVMWNLLSNAVKFTPAGGRVEIHLSRVDRPLLGDDQAISNHSRPMTRYAQIQVIDTGKGIAPDFLPYVFEYFRQADSSTTRKFGGLGLGLAIVQEIVELHGGTVQAESAGEGLGATFTVRLPLTLTAQPSLPTHGRSMAKMNLQDVRILVVDDEADTRELVSFVLMQAGATVMVAASAAEALTIVAQSPVDLLISDIGMPDMDGYSLIRQVRSQGYVIPAIALTAYAGELDQKQALAAGFQKHLTKPIEPAALIEAIALLMDRRSEPTITS